MLTSIVTVLVLRITDVLEVENTMWQKRERNSNIVNMLTVYYALYLLQISGKEGQIKY